MTPTTVQVADTSFGQAPAGQPANARVSHLFRASLNQGRLHPLYLPMLQYRAAKAVPLV